MSSVMAMPPKIAEVEGINWVKEAYYKSVLQKILFIFSLLVLIFILIIFSTTLGTARITVYEVYSAILNHFLPEVFPVSWKAKVCVWDFRLPRILMGVLAGFCLGVAGAVMQGILRNPLASPYTLGIASGAGFGAALAIISGISFSPCGTYLVIANAFIFSLLPTFFIVGISKYRGATPETMILAGIAMLYIFSAATTLMEYFAEPRKVKAVIFWMVGDLGGAKWDYILPALTISAPIFAIILLKSWDMNMINAGDETAISLGVNVERFRISMLVLASLMTATIVCFTGTIGFIGLVAPHMCRIVIGGDNRFLVPASGLLGSSLLLASDTIARTIIAPVILPVGVITSFMGGPLFLYLIMRKRREYW